LPIIYLSPSTQEFNPYVGGGNEELYMNEIADAMLPYLMATGINYRRNSPDMTAASSIAASNASYYDVHLALHSNASAPSNAGNATGSEVYYSPNSPNGKRLAEIIANNLKMIYPNPSKVKTVPTTSLGEVTRTRAPSVLIEYAYHDNPADADWIRNNIGEIARNTVISLADYFGIPFADPTPPRFARVVTLGGRLNLRTLPQYKAFVLASVPNGSTVTVYSTNGDWSVIDYNGILGFANNRYLQFV